MEVASASRVPQQRGRRVKDELPFPQKQKDIIKDLFANYEMQLTDTMYVVSIRWWKRWKRYVRYDRADSQFCFGEPLQTSSIDNSDLLASGT